MEYEKQLKAMKAVMEALKDLDDGDRKAVIGWVNGQLGVKPDGGPGEMNAGALNASPKKQGTVSVVAQKLGASSSRDLLMAAAAHLTLYQGKDAFSKHDLVACAKEARTWKTNYANQMASNIKRMESVGTLFERSKGVFSLSDEAIADIQGRLK